MHGETVKHSYQFVETGLHAVNCLLLSLNARVPLASREHEDAAGCHDKTLAVSCSSSRSLHAKLVYTESMNLYGDLKIYPISKPRILTCCSRIGSVLIQFKRCKRIHTEEYNHQAILMPPYVSYQKWVLHMTGLTYLRGDGFGGLVVSMLASGTQVCGFKPGRSRWIFRT